MYTYNISRYIYIYIYVEVRDGPRTGYVVPGRDGPGVLPNGESCWDAVAAVTSSLGAAAPQTTPLGGQCLQVNKRPCIIGGQCP